MRKVRKAKEALARLAQPAPQPPALWLRCGQAARLLGFSAETVKKYVKAGILKGFRPHARGHFRVSAESVTALIGREVGNG